MISTKGPFTASELTISYDHFENKHVHAWGKLYVRNLGFWTAVGGTQFFEVVISQTTDSIKLRLYFVWRRVLACIQRILPYKGTHLAPFACCLLFFCMIVFLKQPARVKTRETKQEHDYPSQVPVLTVESITGKQARTHTYTHTHIILQADRASVLAGNGQTSRVFLGMKQPGKVLCRKIMTLAPWQNWPRPPDSLEQLGAKREAHSPYGVLPQFAKRKKKQLRGMPRYLEICVVVLRRGAAPPEDSAREGEGTLRG